MFPNYYATGKRCAVDFNSLNLPITETEAIYILSQINFQIADIDVISIARECIGKSTYKRGSSIHKAPEQMDCSSFMKWLYAQRGIKLPRRSIQQRQLGKTVEIADLIAGDLIFVSGHINYYFDDPADGVGHVGIATGENTVIHAANSKVGIIETEVEKFIQKGFRGARRIIPEEAKVITMFVPQEKDVEWSDDIRWIVLQNLGKL